MTTPTVLDQEAILAGLRTRSIGRSLVIVKSCTSTNDVAEMHAHREHAAHGFTVIAEEQTAGRGRSGRTWLSPRGGIWMTLILRAPSVPDAWESLALLGGLAIARSLHSVADVKAKVRWPNDVVVNNRKVAGVLGESRSKGNRIDYVLLGMGINANFPLELLNDVSGAPTTLLRLLGHEINRESLICSTLLETEELTELLLSGETQLLLRLLEETECSRGKTVKVKHQNTYRVGVFESYEGLTRVRIRAPNGDFEILDTALVEFAEYLT